MQFRLLTASLVIGFLSIVTAEATDFCQLTSQTTLQSCREGAQSDFSLALGNCDNLASSAKRQSCRQQASTDLSDAKNTCNDQFVARQAVCKRLGPEPYDPRINPANFSSVIDNPYYPLKPGTTFVYEGQTPDGFEHNEVAVTHKTRKIVGVSVVEVHDRVWTDGKLTEDTLDWFAQDKQGNVWYFGENSKQLENGLVVGLEGSWTGGVDFAKPGIIMEAHPAVGDFYRQEFSLGVGEDVGAVVSLDQNVTVPAGKFDDCLKTKDTTPLEPDVAEFKFYAPGVGQVLETDPATGERLQLVKIKTN